MVITKTADESHTSTDDYRRVTEDYKRVTDESQTNELEPQTITGDADYRGVFPAVKMV